jgi:adenosylcobinamide-GDP ribazoletransferase
VQRLVLAIRYLTIVPAPGRDGGGVSLGAAAPWFAIVGLGLGAALVVTERVSAWLFPSLLASLLLVTVWKLLTGGLHLDGLADCLDGLVGADVSHRLAIMRDSRIGAFGAVGLILFLLLELAAVAELGREQRGGALLAAPTIARAMPAVVARLFPAARPEGHGATFRATLARAAIPAGLAVALVVAAGALGVVGIVALAVALLVSVAIGKSMTTRLGGITGDVLGAVVEAAELVVLLTVSAWTHLRL